MPSSSYAAIFARRVRVLRSVQAEQHQPVRVQHVLERARFRCEHCHRERRLQVHHVSYDHERDEWPQDVLALCRACHQAVYAAEHEARARRPRDC